MRLAFCALFFAPLLINIIPLRVLGQTCPSEPPKCKTEEMLVAEPINDGCLYGAMKCVSKQQSKTTSTPTQASSSVTVTKSAALPTVATSVLMFGMRGSAVLALQKQLISLGYLSSDSATGYFGSATRGAVVAFQKARGLEPVGFVGPRTKTALSEGITSASSQTLPPQSQLTTTGTSSIPYLLALIKTLQDKLAVLKGSPVQLPALNIIPTTLTPESGVVHSWATGAWSACINSSQSRTVACKSSSNSEAEEGNCPSSKPPISQSCSVTPVTQPMCTPLPTQTHIIACAPGQTGSITQTRTSSCASGATSPSYGPWTNTANTCATLIPSTQSCTLAGITVAHGAPHVFYAQQNVAFNTLCSSVAQTRTCANGAFSGNATFQYANCTSQQPASCSWNGSTIPHGTVIVAHLTSTVPFGAQCQTQTRTCTDGVLSGSYTFAACTPGAATSCLLDGVTVNHSTAQSFYSSRTVPFGQNCASVAKPRTCTNGTLSGDASYQYASCTAGQPLSCTFNGRTVPHGGSVSAYQSSSVPFGSQCVSEQRMCTNGVLDGSYIHADCAVSPGPVSGYILPYVNPNATLPLFVNFGTGSWETNSMPDTLDLIQHATLSINALTLPHLREADYEMYWFAELNANPPRLDMSQWERLLPQFWASIQWMRFMTGSVSNLDVDRAWQNRLVKSLSPSGALSFSIYKSYIPNTFDITSYRNLGTQFINDIYAQDWAAFVLANLYRVTSDVQWKSKGIALVDDLQAHGVYCNEAGVHGAYCYVSAPVFTPTYKGHPTVITGAPSSELGGRLIGGLSNFYAATGYVPARDLARKFTNYLINYGGYFDRATGAFVWDKTASDETSYAHGTHIGRHTQALVGLVDYAILTGDTAVTQFIINSFNWAKNAPCSDKPSQVCTNSLIGWFPEFLDSTWPKSDYAVADMIQVAVKLSAAGKADLWEDAERWTRNQFSAQQLQSTGWIRPYSQRFANLETIPSNMCGASSSAVFCTNTNVIESVLGSWGGFVRPNEYMLDSTFSGGHGVMGDSTAWGSMTVFTIWKHSITRASDYLKVNMLFNRASQWATVSSYIPFTGRVDVKIKDTSIQKLYVRIPKWTDSNEARVTKNGVNVSFGITEGYAYVRGPFLQGDVVSIRFPISQRTETISLPTGVYNSSARMNFTFQLKGDMVISVSPAGERGAFYTDRSKYLGTILMKTVQSFIPANTSLLNDYPAPPAPPEPQVLELRILGNGQENTLNVTSGTSVAITWKATGVKSGTCVVYGPKGSPLDVTNLFNGSGLTDVSSPGQSTGPIVMNALYTLRCQKLDGTSTEPKTLSITVSDPVLRIYANGKEGSAMLAMNTAAQITWDAQNVQPGSCRVFGPRATPLDGTNLFNGSGLAHVGLPGQTTGPLSQVSTYSLVCSNLGGSQTAPKIVTVTPTTDPVLSIYGNGQEETLSVPSGFSIGITWKGENVQANSCIVYGPASSPVGLYQQNGDQTNLFNGGAVNNVPAPGQQTGPITALSTYTLRCQASNGGYISKQLIITPY